MGGDPTAIADESETLTLSLDEPVGAAATISFDRPEARNALNTELRADLIELLTAIDDDGAIRVVVLTGEEGTGAFVAGGDITEMADRTALEQREASKRPRVYETVAELSKPVIARINGLALGGGCELAQATDMRFAVTDARLGQPEIRLGIIPGGGGTQRLPRLVGPGHAKRLIFTGELIDGEEAAEIGLVDEAFETEAALDDRIETVTEHITGKSPVAVEFAKTAVDASQTMTLEEGVEYEAELFAGLFATRDRQEGMRAFLDDREPEWNGR